MISDLHLLLPVIIPSTAAVVVLLLSGFFRSRALSMVISIAALVAAALATVGWQESHSLFNGMLTLDPYARLAALVCIGAGAIACLAAPSYLKRMEITYGQEYFALILASVAGMIVMTATNDLMVLFVNLELMSLSTYILCGLNRGSLRSTESALKYFMTGAATSAILIFGIALIYGITGSTNMVRIAAIVPTLAGHSAHMLYLLAGVCVLSAFFFKIGIVPFHAWMPDVYEGAPTPVTGFMSAGVRVAATMAFIRIFIDLFAPANGDWQKVIWWAAVITMTLGNLSAIVQNNVKRMLAYSSIAHAGYPLIAFVGLASANMLGANAVVYYLLSYAIMSLGIFIFVAQVEGKNETNLTFDSYRGLGLRQPLVGALASLLLLSLAGIPPFAGFWGKYSVFAVALKNGYVGLAIIGAINSVVSAYYYFRLMVSMYMRESDTTETVSYTGSLLATLGILVCSFLLLWFGIGPIALGNVIPSVNDVWMGIQNGISALGSGL